MLYTPYSTLRSRPGTNWRVLVAEGDNAVVFMYIISDIDVTSMMTMFTIDIWGDRHASEL